MLRVDYYVMFGLVLIRVMCSLMVFLDYIISWAKLILVIFKCEYEIFLCVIRL